MLPQPSQKSTIAALLITLYVIPYSLYVLPPVTLAQESTPSATIEPSPVDLSSTASAAEEASGEVGPIISDSTSDTILQNLPPPEPVSAPSAAIRQPEIVARLKKKVYRANEKLTVIVANTTAPGTQIKLFNSDGQETPVDVEVVNSVNPTVLTIRPPAQFKAGRFRLQVTTPDGTTSTQDFTWGVLAINTDKSVYLPGETVKLAMAVLDETGIMVCNANLQLTISNSQLGINDTLSTTDKSIVVNPECWVKDFTLKPDFEAVYQVAGIGTYNMHLTAITANGEYSVSDSFEVQESVDFDITRTTATRLYPPESYPVTFDIKFNADFTGTITETVPSVFAITPLSGATPYDTIEIATQSASPAIALAPAGLGLPFDNSYPISQTFGSQPDDPLLARKYERYGVVGHDGVDFALPEGTGVLAVDDGVVVRADVNGDYGQTIVIQHAWGRSYYGHLSLITARVGQKRAKGLPLGLSGQTGLATGPHLHFGIKPADNDFGNGYYGKINPLPYLGLIQDQNGTSFTTGIPSDTAVTTLTWNISAKAGDKLKLGYSFKAPNISPQFYLLGPLEFRDSSGKLLFSETRRWQLAVDADGSGANTVSPDTGTTSTTGNTYTFTFDPSEAMNAGGITITVPDSIIGDWSAPQGTAGTAGYTTAVGTGAATVGNVLDNADVEDPTSPAGIWKEIDPDMCGATTQDAAGDIVVDTTNFIEGSGSIQCADTNGQPDNNDDWGFVYDANQNWETFCNGGDCTSISWWQRSPVNTEAFEFNVSSTTDISTFITGANCAGSVVSANTWEYRICDISTANLSTVKAFGFACTAAACNPFETDVFNVDELLIGPGTPTFSGAGPWTITTRFLDLAATDTVTVTYGSGGGSSGVTNSGDTGTHTFTTQSRLPNPSTPTMGTYTNIATHPTICLSCGPTNDQLMRHGAWFNASGVEQPFTF